MREVAESALRVAAEGGTIGLVQLMRNHIGSRVLSGTMELVSLLLPSVGWGLACAGALALGSDALGGDWLLGAIVGGAIGVLLPVFVKD